jgi:hypothetical protein
VLLATGAVRIHFAAGAVDGDAYQARWRAAWAAVHHDSEPYAPTKSSPGVCNIGGSQQACYETDQRVINDLEGMQRALAGSVVPKQYRAANDLLQRAIAEDITGLRLRDTAFAKQDNAYFLESKPVISQAAGLFRTAYQTFPVYARPTPAP